MSNNQIRFNFQLSFILHRSCFSNVIYQKFNTLFIFIILLLHHWHYVPWSLALVSLVIFEHSSLYSVLTRHLSIPIVLGSSSTSSYHRSLNLPGLRRPSSFRFKDFFRLSFILTAWPNQSNFRAFISNMMSWELYCNSNSELYLNVKIIFSFLIRALSSGFSFYMLLGKNFRFLDFKLNIEPGPH